MPSDHLDNIIVNQNGNAHLQVVFVDIEKYSTRYQRVQKAVIDRFTECLESALEEVSQQYIRYAQRQRRHINFATDVIKLPTGDGAAIAFSFDGLHQIHLDFAKALLKSIQAGNEPCEEFNKKGWCNDDEHANFGIRTGISEGRGIIYKDVNNNYNVAGRPINYAARVMDLGDSGQILFSSAAHEEITENAAIRSGLFAEFSDIGIKHGFNITVYQYLGEGETYVNAAPPEKIARLHQLKNMREQLGDFFGLRLPDPEDPDWQATSERVLRVLEQVLNASSSTRLESRSEPPADAPGQDIDDQKADKM